MIGALREYWVLAGRHAAALELVGPLLESTEPAAPTQERASALVCAGTLAFFRGDNERAAGYQTQAFALAESLGDEGGLADARIGLARVAMQRSEYEEMRRQARLSAGHARQLGDQLRLAVAMHHDAVGADLEESGEGAQLHLQTLELQRQLGNRRGIALELLNLGVVALDRRQPSEATQRLREALAIFTELGVQRNVALSLALIGVAASDEQDCACAAQLLGKALALKQSMQTTFTAAAEHHIERALEQCSRELGDERLRALMREGEATSEDAF